MALELVSMLSDGRTAATARRFDGVGFARRERNKLVTYGRYALVNNKAYWASPNPRSPPTQALLNVRRSVDTYQTINTTRACQLTVLTLCP